jgi:hypothetical protein
MRSSLTAVLLFVFSVAPAAFLARQSASAAASTPTDFQIQ